ncbi:MAG: protein kinase domain-containing protein [Gammaproteobacteria bacterium]
MQISESDRVGGGGEGAVYVAHPGDGKKIAVKVFNDKKLSENRDILCQKIARMVEIGKQRNNALINYPMVAWPQLVCYDGKGEFVGYGMRLAKGKALSRLAHPMLHREHFPDMDRVNVADMLIRLWQSAQFLHERRIYIGDVNTNNVLCSDRYGVCWIDVDSFQIENWRCLVGRPEMTPPEHLGREYSDFDRTRESDLFSLAVMSFQCLMLGRHPYDHIGAGKPVDNLRDGKFPYVKGGSRPGTRGGIPNGHWHKMWSHYTNRLMGLFVRTFDGINGTRRPLERPSPEEWIGALENFKNSFELPPARRLDNGETWRRCRAMIPAEEKPPLKWRGCSLQE